MGYCLMFGNISLLFLETINAAFCRISQKNLLEVTRWSTHIGGAPRRSLLLD